MMSGPRPSPDPGAWSGVLAAVSFIGGVASAMALADTPYPRPGTDVAAVQKYFQGSSRAARVSVAGQLVSAASLARFTVSVAGLSGRPGRGARSLRAAATAGGAGAAASLLVSAAASAALTGRQGEREASARALHRLVFAAGGPVHTAAFGVLVGSLAVAGLRTGALPRPLAVAGLASAAAGLLSPLTFVAAPAAVLIPAGRVTGLAVSAIAGARLARRPR
jgi:hypothetical protein